MSYENIKSRVEELLEEVSDAEEQPTYQRKSALLHTAYLMAERITTDIFYEYSRIQGEMGNKPPIDGGKL